MYDLQIIKFLKARHPFWGTQVTNLLQQGIKGPSQGVDAQDHPPITPVCSATPSEFDPKTWRVFELICRVFVAALSDHCEYSTITTTLLVPSSLVTPSSIKLGFYFYMRILSIVLISSFKIMLILYKLAIHVSSFLKSC